MSSTAGKTLKETGEFALLRRIRSSLKHTVSPHKPVVDIGDDAFVSGISGGHKIAVTTDMLVENIHFRRDWATPFQIGYKAMAVNVSDLAAMGKCRPLYAFVSIALPGDIPLKFVDNLYTGMRTMAQIFQFYIAGGDTVSSRKDIVISITLVGEISVKYLLTRGCAQPGDAIMVSGCLGDSSAGLFLLKKAIKRPSGFEKKLIQKHLMPYPRLEAACRLAQTGYLHSMMDISDGLAASVGFIAQASGTGADIEMEKLPLSPSLKQCATRYKAVDPYRIAAAGGEEFELVFTVPASRIPALARRVPDITRVGTITRRKGIHYYFHGKPQKKVAGFEHFSQEKQSD